MIFYFKTAQNLVAEHYERYQNLVAEHYERYFKMIFHFKTVKTWLQSTMKEILT